MCNIFFFILISTDVISQEKGDHKALISNAHLREVWLMLQHVLAGFKGFQMGAALFPLLSKTFFLRDYPNLFSFLSVMYAGDCERRFNRYN